MRHGATPQLIPKLKELRRTGVLATLEGRHRQAMEGQWASRILRF